MILLGRGHVYYGQHCAQKGLNCSTSGFAVALNDCLAFLFFSWRNYVFGGNVTIIIITYLFY